MAREAAIRRTTKETDIAITLELDGSGATSIDTGVAFFDHMLDAFGRHGLFDLSVKAVGDLDVDAHHTVEDCGIVLGQAFAQALGDCAGITRFGSIMLPMDESLVACAIDISGRGQLHWAMQVPTGFIGTREDALFDTSLAKEFFIAFAANAGITLHLRQLAGENAHHIIEAAFKACAKAMMQAVAPNPRLGGAVPSTKGSI